ncbi:hypothetical protein WKE44_25155 [Klebsiella pneumoniae]|uniref:hypothetical protein n=1 Tax=Klebsiella pneumoniae TaxID=573 RepID=UPI0030C03081
MSRVVFTPELVRELIDYDPETGVMTWRERRAQLYLDLVPGITMEAALSRAGRFNMTWAGREVGTDQVYKSVNRRVRISFGSGITAVRKNATTVAWMLGAGREPQSGKEVITWDGNPRNLAAENIVEVSTPVRYILENPAAGLIQRQDGKWTWVINHTNNRLRGTGEGYDDKQAARAARDEKLAELGLGDITRLSDVINGKD